MSTSILTIHLLLALVLIMFTQNSKTLANSIYRQYNYLPQSYIYDDDQNNNLSSELINNGLSSSNNWPRTYRSSYTPPVQHFDFRRGVIRFYPYKKRTIPLELQKALYAHGIVGRRR